MVSTNVCLMWPHFKLRHWHSADYMPTSQASVNKLLWRLFIYLVLYQPCAVDPVTSINAGVVTRTIGSRTGTEQIIVLELHSWPEDPWHQPLHQTLLSDPHSGS